MKATITYVGNEPIKNRRGNPKTRGVKVSPILHVLYPDGKEETYKRRPIVIPGASSRDVDAVYAVLVNGDGEPFVDPQSGKPIVFEALPLLLGGLDEPDDKMLTWDEVAQRAGISVSTLERAVRGGLLRSPQKVSGGRAVRFRLGDVRAYINSAARK